jgi:hypothetical protein
VPLYLLDANVLITAHREYYPHHRVPQFWAWLLYVCSQGHAKLPVECYEEISEGADWLATWVKKHKADLVLDEESDPLVVARILDSGYASDLTDDEVDTIGRDPFLVAYAEGDADRIVVTTEVSRPGKRRANRKIPDVCEQFRVKWVHTFAMLDALGFTTDWEPPDE